MKVCLTIVLLCVTGLLTACGGSTTPAATPPTAIEAGAQQASTVPLTPAAAIQPGVVPSVPPADAPTHPATPTAAAPETHASSLIAPGPGGLLLISSDGQRKQTLDQARPSSGHDLVDGIAPHNGRVAFAGGDNPLTPDREGSGPLTLNVLDVHTGAVKPITPLFSPEMEQAIKTDATHFGRTAAIEAGIAIAENDHTLAWSPDGRYLAFIAAIDGPSSDVYSYDRESGQINRLTDGPNQAARLFWSPDSQWIVHEEVENFGTGAGWNVKAAWAAAPDGNNTRKLYDATFSGDEVFVDWITPNTFLVYAWTPIGLQNVRLVNLNTGEGQRIGPAFAVQAFAFDPQSKAQLYVVDELTANQNNLTGGLYLATSTNQPRQIASGDWYNVQWLPHAGMFFAKGRDGVISVTPDGAVKKYEAEGALPIDSPDGAWLLAWGDGNFTSPIGLRLYTRDGERAREITSNSVTFATWSPDSNGVFYLSEGALYFASIPNGEPTLIAEKIVGGAESMGWVKP